MSCGFAFIIAFKMKINAALAISLSFNALAVAAAMEYYCRWHRARPEISSAARYYDRRCSLFNQLQPSSKPKVVFAGDSLINECEWAELLSRPETVNRGIDFDTTAGLLQRIHSITALHPKKLFLLIGVNDLQRRFSQQSVVDNYRDILLAVRAESPKTVVYVQSILPVSSLAPGATLSMNHALSAFARQHAPQYIDISSAMSGPDGHLHPEYTNDGVHLMSSGYEQWKSVLISSGALRD